MDPIPRVPNGTPPKRHTPLQNLLHLIPWKFIFPSESLVRKSPPCSSAGSLWGEKTPSPEPLLCLYMYVCHSPPKKKPSYKVGKNIKSPSTEPDADGRPTHNGVRPGSSRGSLMTLLSLPQCHAALGTIPSNLAWVDQRLVSQRVIPTPNRVYPPHLLPPPTWPRVE